MEDRRAFVMRCGAVLVIGEEEEEEEEEESLEEGEEDGLFKANAVN